MANSRRPVKVSPRVARAIGRTPKPIRKAGARISSELQNLEAALVPNVDKPSSGAYYHGMDEQTWDRFDRDIAKGILSGRYMEGDIDDKIRMGEAETDRLIKHVRNHGITNHRYMGVPHVQSNEGVMIAALQDSGINAWDNNQRYSTQTDLAAMVNNLERYIDVQHRVGRSAGYGIIKDGDASKIESIMRDASPSDTLQTVINRLKGSGMYHHDDKLLKTLDSRYNIRPDRDLSGRYGDRYQIDYLLGGEYDNITNVLGNKAMYGFYDPTAPRNVLTTDLGAVREALFNMSMREFNKNPGIRRLTGGDLDKKLKVSISPKVLQEMGAFNTQLITPEVTKYLNSRA